MGMAGESGTLQKLNLEGNIAVNWEKWKRAFDVMVVANGITDNKIKKYKMLHNGGMELQDIYYSLPQDAESDEKKKENEFLSMLNALDAYFLSKTSSALERRHFRSMTQNQEETINQFVVRLRQQAAKCQFDNAKEHVRDQIVYNSKHSELEKKVIEKGSVELDELIKIVQGLEIIEMADKEVRKVTVSTELNQNGRPSQSKYNQHPSQSKSKDRSDYRRNKSTENSDRNRSTGKRNELAFFRCGHV